jgi:hypothetical protein
LSLALLWFRLRSRALSQLLAFVSRVALVSLAERRFELIASFCLSRFISSVAFKIISQGYFSRLLSV